MKIQKRPVFLATRNARITYWALVIALFVLGGGLLTLTAGLGLLGWPTRDLGPGSYPVIACLPTALLVFWLGIRFVTAKIDAHDKVMGEHRFRITESRIRAERLQERFGDPETCIVLFAPDDRVRWLNEVQSQRGKPSHRAAHMFRIEGIGDYAVFVPTTDSADFSLRILRLETVGSVDGGTNLGYELVPDTEERRYVARVYREHLKKQCTPMD